MPDDATTLAELETAVARSSDERDWAVFHGAKDLAIGVVTEGAEVLEVFRFMAEPAVRSRVENELADVFFFVLRLARRYEIDPSAAFARKLALNAGRSPRRQGPRQQPEVTGL